MDNLKEIVYLDEELHDLLLTRPFKITNLGIIDDGKKYDNEVLEDIRWYKKIYKKNFMTVGKYERILFYTKDNKKIGITASADDDGTQFNRMLNATLNGPFNNFMIRMAKRIANGEEFKARSAIFNNEGMQFCKHHIFGDSEYKFVKWSDIMYGVSNGCVTLGLDNGFDVTLNFENDKYSQLVFHLYKKLQSENFTKISDMLQ